MPGNGVNIDNNIPVVMVAFHDGTEGLKGWITSKWNKMGMTKMRSIKEKDLDLFLVTETWLKLESNDSDLIWQKLTCLNNNEIQMDCVDRINDQRGSGIVLIFKDNIRSKLTEKGNLRTFEYGLLNIMNGNNNFEILGLYHPPHLIRIIT